MNKFRNLRADEVDARVGTCNENGFSLLLYKDARCDQNILDETVGAENWQRRHYDVKGNMFCSVGIYVADKKEWVWKDDCGTESNTEKEKGEASDSFKRACFNWGIGRELYTAPFIYIKSNTAQNQKKQWVPTYKSFTVKELESENGKIIKLQIVGYAKDKGSEVIFEYGPYGAENATRATDDRPTMSLEEARQLTTKSGKRFYELSSEQLEYIIDHGGARSSMAAKLVYEDMTTGDMEPIWEDGLPF